MKRNAIISAMIGSFFTLISFWVLQYLGNEDALMLSIFGGLFFYILLFGFLLVYGKILNRKYAAFEKEIISPIFYRTNGNFSLDNNKIKNGNIYFCEAGIVFVCLEEKPYALDEIALQDIERYEFDNIHLNIFAKDGRVFVFSSPDVTKIIEVLKQKEWI